MITPPSGLEQLVHPRGLLFNSQYHCPINKAHFCLAELDSKGIFVRVDVKVKMVYNKNKLNRCELEM